MQSSGSLSDVPPTENEGGFQRRPGQILYRSFINEHLERPHFAARLPTGYGKTESILDGFDVLRHHHQANRLLIVVPTDVQERAYAQRLAGKAKRMGITLTGIVSADSAVRTIRTHRENQAEVFVLTMGRLLASVTGRNHRGNWMYDLLETGRWVGAADEYHHYAQHNAWGQAFANIPQVGQWMALSATPDRREGETIFGAPAVNISYDDALQEKPCPLKKVTIKVREYGVDIKLETNAVIRRTTSEIRDEVNAEPVDRWETRKQLRYLTKYCSPILLHAIGDLEKLRLEAPARARPQMLVYAFSCLHAQSLCSLIARQAPGLLVAWAGTGPNGRREDENKAIVDQFLNVESDVLVQVNLAAEGFDSIPVCVIVDLSLTGFSTQKLQAYGRGTRAYHKLPLIIYVPTDSNVAPLAPLMHKIFDQPVDSVSPADRCECCDECPRCEHHRQEPEPLPKLEVINATLIGGTDYGPIPEMIIAVAPEIGRALQRDFDVEHNQADYDFIKDIIVRWHRRTDEIESEENKIKYWQKKIKAAVGQVARNVLLVRQGFVEGSQLGDLCIAINTHWKIHRGGHDEMLVKEFEEKYKWLDELNSEIIAKRIPRWLA